MGLVPPGIIFWTRTPLSKIERSILSPSTERRKRGMICKILMMGGLARDGSLEDFDGVGWRHPPAIFCWRERYSR